MMGARWWAVLVLVGVGVVSFLLVWRFTDEVQLLVRSPAWPLQVGEVLDSHRGVAVHYNGLDFRQSHGSRNSEDGYYYGKSWQCVEYVKRFYFEAKGHRMPNVWGHARDFFDPKLANGALNAGRGLVQFTNGSVNGPAVDDLVVFRGGAYGHVAIVSLVGDDFVELVQQNVGRHARVRRELVREPSGGYRIAGNGPPAGWLRLPLPLK